MINSGSADVKSRYLVNVFRMHMGRLYLYSLILFHIIQQVTKHLNAVFFFLFRSSMFQCSKLIMVDLREEDTVLLPKKF